MINCWNVIPCDLEMRETCPHYLANELCPMNCWMAVCNSPKRSISDDPLLIFKNQRLPEPAKKECLSCRQYLENADSDGGK